MRVTPAIQCDIVVFEQERKEAKAAWRTAEILGYFELILTGIVIITIYYSFFPWPSKIFQLVLIPPLYCFLWLIYSISKKQRDYYDSCVRQGEAPIIMWEDYGILTAITGFSLEIIEITTALTILSMYIVPALKI